jgi:hypothetical protein
MGGIEVINMAIYKTSDNKLWDDMGGEAKNYPSWPSDAVLITDSEAEAIRSSQVSEPAILTPAEKLASFGLTVEELKTLIAEA